jgi:hypothetical protein
MDDAELKRLVYGCVPGTSEWVKPSLLLTPATIDALLSRLSAAEARVGVLEEALRVQRGYVAVWVGDVECGVKPTLGSLQDAKDFITLLLTREADHDLS